MSRPRNNLFRPFNNAQVEYLEESLNLLIDAKFDEGSSVVDLKEVWSLLRSVEAEAKARTEPLPIIAATLPPALVNGHNQERGLIAPKTEVA